MAQSCWQWLSTCQAKVVEWLCARQFMRNILKVPTAFKIQWGFGIEMLRLERWLGIDLKNYP